MNVWYGNHWSRWLLAPASLVFALAVASRRALYALGALESRRVALPVVVIGNIAVGGTGKTPLVAWLARALKRSGYSPGIVCRGYRGEAVRWPQRVSAESDPRLVGDEAVLLAEDTGCPVIADPDRVRAARRLVAAGECDVIISDDGLQHYRLARDVEIAVVDGERRHGNGWCLPGGPLREPISRLASVDAVVANGDARDGEWTMRLEPGPARALDDPMRTRPLAAFAGERVSAICGIGNPARFFELLRRAGIDARERHFPDHHAYTADDLAFAHGGPLLMTSKDAVKCRRLAPSDGWSVTVDACVEPGLLELIERALARCEGRRAQRAS